MSKKQIIAIIVTILLLIAIPLGIYLAKKQQTVKSRASFTTAGDINGDWCINEQDYAYWRANYNPSETGGYDKYTEWLQKFKSMGAHCVSQSPSPSPSP